MAFADDLREHKPPPGLSVAVPRVTLAPIVPRHHEMSIMGLLNPEGVRPHHSENLFKQQDILPPDASETTPSEDGLDGVPKRGLSCTVAACPNKAVSKGRCISHGGGCRCKIPNCKNGAKMYGLCHLHGGRKKCKFGGCNKFAKSMGLCWAHGGSKTCGVQRCEKGALKGGLCWAHGGGTGNRGVGG
ncbi:hypothetical protein ACHHYP_10945 [Achlya hypogyna]|uniref:WRKY19-like zinc finger domain-containing protein n=1 Tax=Achlya hypogyna TaxID=1202772 RepID=A0A1V9YK62_ACHHY|nr:hypothetical protein ACHHYP_10945 [Achlya hypogyna]